MNRSKYLFKLDILIYSCDIANKNIQIPASQIQLLFLRQIRLILEMERSLFIYYLVILIFLPVSVPAFSLGDIEVSIGAWQQSPSGYVSYKSDDKLDLQDVLSYDTEIRFFARLKCELPFMLPNVYLTAAPMGFKAASITDDFYDFGDIVIFPGIPFKSKLNLNQFDIGLYYDIPLLEKISLKWLSLEMGLNAKFFDAEAFVIQDTLIPGFEIKESEKEFAIIPMLYLGIFVQPTDRFAFEGEFRGISYRDNDFYSLIGRLKINTYGSLFVATGYRYDEGQSDISNLKFDVNFSGPFFETGMYF